MAQGSTGHPLKTRKSPIAQDLETPLDFWGFEYLARLSGKPVIITYVYKPVGASFSISDVDDVLRRRDVCARACGWNTYGPVPQVYLFFVAQRNKQLRLTAELMVHLASKREVTYYRIGCSFSYGISLRELDDQDRPVDMYERERS